MLGWLKSLMSLTPPPLPSEYIARYLSGAISHDEFASNVGDGWIGSNLKNRFWLDRIHDLERRYNPGFPSLSPTAFVSESAKAELADLMIELRRIGQ